MNREELAWAAGFYDGEGCCGVWQHGGTNHNKTLGISITQMRKEPLERFETAMKHLGKIYRKKKTLIYRFQSHRFERVQMIVALMWNWLSAPKKEQITRSFAAYLNQYREGK